MLLFIVVYDASSNLGTPSFTNQAQVRHIGKIRRKRLKAINKSVCSRLQRGVLTAHGHVLRVSSTYGITLENACNTLENGLYPLWLQIDNLVVFEAKNGWCIVGYKSIQSVTTDKTLDFVSSHVVRARGLQAAMFIPHR